MNRPGAAPSGRRRINLIGIISAAMLGLGLMLSAAPLRAEGSAPTGIRWQQWSDDLFTRAKAEKRLVLLDLEAVWCHWCHVMDVQTYRDPEVIRLLGQHYIAVKVDQDARPDLSNRYEDYGWPAIIVYGSDGTELVKRSGYIPAPGMAAMLQAVVDDPTPGPSAPPTPPPDLGGGAMTAALRSELGGLFTEQYDATHGGWGFGHKYLDGDSVEYAAALARAGDTAALKMAQQTLDAQRALIDPVWGGVYQYSTGGDWKEPHFEKIMSMQAASLRSYAMAYQQWQRPADLDSARRISRYMADFLTGSDGAFYTSQDADIVQGEHAGDYFALDDAARRKRGIPRVDRHHYARENGWAIEALARLYAADPDPQTLHRATSAARWIVAHRGLKGGGFRHDTRDAAGPFLGDTLAMARAFLALHAVTADREWLKRAEAAAGYIEQHFQDRDAAGFRTAVGGRKSTFQPRPLRGENADLARFASLLFHYTGEPRYQAMATQAMRYLAMPTVARRFPVAATLLADRELQRAPVHLTVVGRKDDPAAIALFATAVALPTPFKRLDWLDVREGPPRNPDVQYPQMARAALFVCTDKRCSAPLFTPEAFASKRAALLPDS